jgi:hypothetical protein
VDWIQLTRYGPVADYCKPAMNLRDECREFLVHLSDYQLLKKDVVSSREVVSYYKLVMRFGDEF